MRYTNYQLEDRVHIHYYVPGSYENGFECATVIQVTRNNGLVIRTDSGKLFVRKASSRTIRKI